MGDARKGCSFDNTTSKVCHVQASLALVSYWRVNLLTTGKFMVPGSLLQNYPNYLLLVSQYQRPACSLDSLIVPAYLLFDLVDHLVSV